MYRNLIVFVTSPSIFETAQPNKKSGMDEITSFCKAENIQNIFYLSTPELLNMGLRFRAIVPNGIFVAGGNDQSLDLSDYNNTYQFLHQFLKEHNSVIKDATNFFIVGLGNTITDACLMLLSMSPDFQAQVFQLMTEGEQIIFKKVFLPNASDLSSLLDKKWLEIKQNHRKLIPQGN